MGLALSAWAWVVVASVFNGFSAFLEEVFQRVDPHIRIVGTGLNDSLVGSLRQRPEVAAVSGVYERIGVLKYGQRQAVVRVRLVDKAYAQVSRVGAQLVYGEGFPLVSQGVLLGAGVANRIVLLDVEEQPLWLYLIPSGKKLAISGMESLLRRRVLPQGIFSVQREYDDSWVIGAQADWPEVHGPYDVIEVRLRESYKVEKVLLAYRKELPGGVILQDARKQHEGLFRILAQEKVLARIGLFFLMLLTVSGAISTLSTFFLQNKRDWVVYYTLGAPMQWVEWLLTYIGGALLFFSGVSGSLIGILTVWTQDHFHWAKLRGGEGFLLQHFPVRLQLSDFLWLAVIFGGIAVFFSLYLRHQLKRLSVRAALQGD
jgi:ABC-type lipoprotein release transport system permease subunit